MRKQNMLEAHLQKPVHMSLSNICPASQRGHCAPQEGGAHAHQSLRRIWGHVPRSQPCNCLPLPNKVFKKTASLLQPFIRSLRAEDKLQ
eukprot:CAMPEP_0180690694 /NCGR_PEP_ID=MMETSP1037_2-20121125/75147_1 /TAXON_ID=632150 /ORGANISM="Azadinium spinosum, Strain 3D9" /LENGTH=88 /DNA_ID=CAMNT_0022721611 /DNA_START=392 /DNA_END=658 /DNA_ORIENTATION=+